MLAEALAVIRAWGFIYKTCGHHTRGNTEPCLLATRGRPVRIDKGVRQVVLDELDEDTIFSQRGEHSAKPACVRDRIVKLYGDVPRIELFARQRAEGWAAWGNQLPAEAKP